MSCACVPRTARGESKIAQNQPETSIKSSRHLSNKGFLYSENLLVKKILRKFNGKIKQNKNKLRVQDLYLEVLTVHGNELLPICCGQGITFPYTERMRYVLRYNFS